MDFPTSDADLRPFINRDIRLISKKSVTYNLARVTCVMLTSSSTRYSESALVTQQKRPLILATQYSAKFRTRYSPTVQHFVYLVLHFVSGYPKRLTFKNKQIKKNLTD